MLDPQQIEFEPFKIKMVEPIAAARPLLPEAVSRREQILRSAYYNLFKVPAKDVTIDLLTDSGTGSMSQEQWAGMFLGDESYAQATSFTHFEDSVRSVTDDNFHIIPTHQGRAAENILFYVLNHRAARDAAIHNRPLRRRVLINSFFDTTAANVMLHGNLDEAEFPVSTTAGYDERQQLEQDQRKILLIGRNQLVVNQCRPDLFEHGVFGGNVNLDKLEAILSDPAQRAEVMLVMATATNNTGGGLPVSLANLHAIRAMIDRYSKDDPIWIEGLPPLMFILDACRFAENAYFIQQHEPGMKGRCVADIAREMFSLVDGCTMSAKKDGMANIGGFLATRHEALRSAAWEYMVEIEGFYTYGGLAGRDLEAIAVGMLEGVNDARVAQRVTQVQRLWQMLKNEGVPVKEPCGGHGVFLKGWEFWSKNGKLLVEKEDLPGHLLAVELYRRYGIRACEIGTIMFGDVDPSTLRVTRVAPDEDFVRLAVPRRTYTESHMAYVAAALAELYRERERASWKGVRFTYRPNALPHFLSHFEPILK